MKISLKLNLLIIVLFLTSTGIMVGQDNAKEIFIEATKILLTENVEMTMDVNVADDKGRLKSKSFTVLLAKFGNEEKTKVTWEKPERAKGTTVIITDTPNQTGIIEVYTPSNGKTRKLKATEENMNMMGSELSMTSFAKYNPDELNYKQLADTLVNGNKCYRIEVSGKDSKAKSNAVLFINQRTYHIQQTTVYDDKGKALSYTELSAYKQVNGAVNKMYPTRIVTKDYKNNKDISIDIVKITTRKGLKISDFTLPESAADSQG